MKRRRNMRRLLKWILLFPSVALAQQPAAPSPPLEAPNPQLKEPKPQLKEPTVPATAETGDLLRQIHQLNQVEMEIGFIAKSNAKSTKVRAYGKHLAKDHQVADKKVIELAGRQGVPLTEPQKKPQEEKAEQVGLMERLRKLKGKEFDQEFLSAMVTEHGKAIQKLETAKENTGNTEIKNLIGEMLPKLEQHRKLANDLLEQKPAG